VNTVNRTAIKLVRRLFISTIITFACVPSGAQATPNLNLNVPPIGSPNWGPALNNNFRLLDTWSSTVCPKSACTLTGPLTAFSLTATSLPAGQCLQTTAGGVLSATGAPCPTGSANISGQANGVIPLATGIAAIGAQSPISVLSGIAQLTSPADTAKGLQIPTANAAVTTYSVLAYGGALDRVTGTGSIVLGSATLTCGSCGFTSAAVGKWVVLTPNGTWTPPFSPISSNALLNSAQIASLISSTQVTMSRASTVSENVNVAWGTDNATARVACGNAVRLSPTGSGNCTWPAGNYLIASAAYPTLLPGGDDGSYSGSFGGSGATLSCTISGGGLSVCSVSAGGSGYTDSSTLQTSISGGCATTALCGQAWVTAATNSSGVVISATVVLPGWGFTSPPTVTVKQLGGDGATATATVTAGTMNTPTLSTGGSGYAPSTTLDWYALNSGGSTCTVTGTFGGTPIVGKGTVAINSSGAAAGAMTVTQNATSCGGTPPIIITSDYACNSGTLGSPVWGQCSNMSPTAPVTVPVQIPVSIGVSDVGVSGATARGANLISAWDNVTVDNNEPVIFGGQVQNMDFTNLSLSNGFIGIYANNNANYTNWSGLNFFTNIGIYTAATDLGFTADKLNFYGSTSWVNGGDWCSRNEFPQGCGGFFDASSVTNLIPRLGAYSTLASNTDNWFANNIWHPEYSGASTDFNETCKFPQTVSQRQTSHVLNSNAGNVHANSMCFRGPSGAGMTILVRDARASGGASFGWLISKNNFRPLFQGDAGGFNAYAWNCEGCIALTGTNDPYRNATQQEGAIVVNDIGSSVAHGPSFNAILWSGSTVNRNIWSISAGGTPLTQANGVAWSNNTGSSVVNQQPSANPQYSDKVNFGAGVSTISTIAATVGYDLYAWFGNTNNYEGTWEGGFNKASFIGADGSTDIIDLNTTAITPNVPFASVPLATARKGTFTCTSGGTIAVANSNFTATSTIWFGIKTVGGTPGPLAQTTPVPSTGFSVICATGDTSVYNYQIPN
jgi:hypothetical protein